MCRPGGTACAGLILGPWMCHRRLLCLRWHILAPRGADADAAGPAGGPARRDDV